jgi:uncharacterized protein (DUF433 family)
MGGKPCIRGMRVTVGMIINQIGAGHSIEEVLANYPYLEHEDILQALQYAAWRVIEAIHWSVIGKVDAPDIEIMEYAKTNGYLEQYEIKKMVETRMEKYNLKNNVSWDKIKEER